MCQIFFVFDPFYTLDFLAPNPFTIMTFKGWISLETMKLWLLVRTKTLFLMTMIIKLTSGDIFIKVENSVRGRHHH